MKLTQQMDSHDIGRGRGGCAAALARISARTLIMGMDSDILYPLREQSALHAGIPGSAFKEITTSEGHDGFLLEYEQVESAIAAHLDAVRSARHHGSGDVPRHTPRRARL
jgi:homoserine O-acetyltransferase